jgi:hypothetical protein
MSSGNTKEKSLAIYRDLVLAGVSTEYQGAMRRFPVQITTTVIAPHRSVHFVVPQSITHSEEPFFLHH